MTGIELAFQLQRTSSKIYLYVALFLVRYWDTHMFCKAK